MSFYLVRSPSAPRLPERNERDVRVARGEQAAPRGARAPEPAARRGVEPATAARADDAARANEDRARTEVATDAGRVVRDVVARWASARAYGVTVAREVDFIDVHFEEVRETAFVRGILRVPSLRALPSGDREA